MASSYPFLSLLVESNATSGHAASLALVANRTVNVCDGASEPSYHTLYRQWNCPAHLGLILRFASPASSSHLHLFAVVYAGELEAIMVEHRGNKAATLIQSQARRMQAQRELRRRKLQRAEEHRAARKLQGFARQGLALQRVKEKREIHDAAAKERRRQERELAKLKFRRNQVLEKLGYPQVPLRTKEPLPQQRLEQLVHEPRKVAPLPTPEDVEIAALKARKDRLLAKLASPSVSPQKTNSTSPSTTNALSIAPGVLPPLRNSPQKPPFVPREGHSPPDARKPVGVASTTNATSSADRNRESGFSLPPITHV